MVRQEHLGVKFEMFQFVNLRTNVFQDAHSPDSLYEFFLLELMRRTRHDVYFYSTSRSPNQPLDNNRVLITLILEKDGILRIVNKLRDAVAAVAAAPDQVGMFVALEGLSFPICLEAFDDFSYFVSMRRHDGVITGFGEVLRLPIQGLYKSCRIIHHHRLFMSNVILGIAVDDVNTTGLKPLTGLLVFRFAITTSWIQHDPYFYAAVCGGNYGFQK